jgi:hypothetical protein
MHLTYRDSKPHTSAVSPASVGGAGAPDDYRFIPPEISPVALQKAVQIVDEARFKQDQDSVGLVLKIYATLRANVQG